MTEDKVLTEKDIKNIGLGYNWNPEMSYEEFVKSNQRIEYHSGHEVYALINERYIVTKFS